MRRALDERGGAKFSTIVWIVLLAVFGMALWNVGPAYIADYTLGDELIQIARRPFNRREGERVVVNMIMEEVEALELEDYIKPTQIKVNTKGQSRQIQLEYERTIEILPSWVRTFVFEHDVDERIF